MACLDKPQRFQVITEQLKQPFPSAPAFSYPEILAKFQTFQNNPETRFQVTIKSILRWKSVERLVKSIKRWYPNVEILIVDDSFESMPDNLPEEIERVISTPGVTWYQVEYDYGLSASRSFLMREATSDYVINCDDDFVFTEETKIHLLADILDQDKSVDIAAGLVRMDGKVAEEWNGHFEFVKKEKGYVLEVLPLQSEWKRCNNVWYRQTDLTWNFYCARKSRLIENPRDPRFKIVGEHLDHFLGFHRDGIKTVETPNIIVGHLENRPQEYLKMRRRYKEFFDPLMEKWEILRAPNHKAGPAKGIEVKDVEQMLLDQHREKPNIVLLTVGHTGSSVVSKMLGELGWNLADADEEYGESVSIRSANQKKDWSNAEEILDELGDGWVIKDPRFCEHLDKWKPYLIKHSPILVWITKNEEEVVGSYDRRGESLELLSQRLEAAKEHYDNWTGPKIKIDYSQIQGMISLWR